MQLIMLKKIINLFLFFLLRLRYSICFKGLDTITPDGRPILFLPNHQALIDPVIVMNGLLSRFSPRPLADENQFDSVLLKAVKRFLRIISIPDLALSGRNARKQVTDGLKEVVRVLHQGDAVLLYPSGKLCRTNVDVVGGNSGVAAVVSQVPEVRIVLLRIRGLWGSSFSRAHGVPSFLQVVKQGAKRLLANGFFFMPRRKVTIEVAEAKDFPHTGSKQEINRFLEQWYNLNPDRNTWVPLYWWQGRQPQYRPEPAPPAVNRSTKEIPDTVRHQVLAKLEELSGIPAIKEEDSLAADLALDSLVLVEFGSWLQEEFAVSPENLESLQTVADCILAAGGIMPVTNGVAFTCPVTGRWFAKVSETTLRAPAGKNVAEIFLANAVKHPGQVIFADQLRGDTSWRQIIMAIFALLPEIKKIPGNYVGIMLPGSVTAVISWLTVVFAGKVPVMVNWTTGKTNMEYCLQDVGVTHVLTAKALATKLAGQGIDLDLQAIEWVYLENIAASLSALKKIIALVKSRMGWNALKTAKIADTAAILFTSGSETRPKAVPLSHANLLANVRDFAAELSLSSNDRQLGILPVFHSLGLAGTLILPLCTGLRTVFWPNPTEGAILAKMIALYKTSMLISTPTFLHGILRTSDADSLSSLRLVFSGAEKCPEHVYKDFGKICPQAVLCEGYGVTECSPVISVNAPENPKPGTIGKVLPSMDYVLVHPETRQQIREGETGQLLVRGENVFAGYLGEAPSPFVEHNGHLWYDTGDLVYEKGEVLTFAGRLKRFVKLGGEMISLPAIEQVLENAFATGEDRQLAVTATQDEEHPQLVMLATFNTDRQEVNQAVKKAGLSPLHNIRIVKTIEEIPVLGTGKTDYATLDRMV
jgi:long-chain-fatty-acid--[acyl-carrier-protein] ligase